MPKIEQSRIDTIKRAVSLLNWVESDGFEPKELNETPTLRN